MRLLGVLGQQAHQQQRQEVQTRGDAEYQFRGGAAELTAGAGHERFDFTVGLMLDGLTRR